MLIKRRKHSVPSLNTTSTADISFMLLTFFLVTSSMDVDKGLVRQLPPLDKEEQTDEAKDVSKENTLAFSITAQNEVMLNGIVIIGVGICSGTVAKKPQHPDKFIDARLRYTAETGLFGFLHFAASLLSTHFTVNAHLHAEKNA